VLDYGLMISPRHVRVAASIFVIGMAGATVAAWVITTVHGDFTSTAAAAASHQHGAVLVVFALSTVLVAPVCEEVAFRGLLFTALHKRGLADRAVVVISAAVFAAYHLEPTRFLLLFVLGLALGEVRLRTGSTSAAMITHALVNLLPAITMLTK
jgi:membrane protease YdiL (CAAX protease family)